MNVGSVVIVHLKDPSEKYWGLVLRLDAMGVTVRGVNLESFEDWMQAVASERDPDIGLATVFFPMLRIERIFLDEPAGVIESLSQRFERRVGQGVMAFLQAEELGTQIM